MAETPLKSIRRMCRSADTHRARGKYKEAESLYLDALRLAEAVFGEGHSEVSLVCNNLAVLYKYMACFDDAEQLYRRALTIIERELGPDHPEVATIYHNLGGLEHARGNFAAGEPLARRSAQIRE